MSFTTFFPPAYGRRICDFSSANAIRQAVNSVDWDRELNCLNIDERVKFFTEYVLNVFSSFVPNKAITITSKDTLWMTPETKRMILGKAKFYRR